MTETLLLIFGAYWFFAGIRLILDPGFGDRMLDHFDDNEVLSFIIGIMALIAGIALLRVHNLWGDWREIFATVILWGGAIEGAILIAYPKPLMAFARKLMPSPKYLKLFGVVILLIGAALIWLNF